MRTKHFTSMTLLPALAEQINPGPRPEVVVIDQDGNGIGEVCDSHLCFYPSVDPMPITEEEFEQLLKEDA